MAVEEMPAVTASELKLRLNGRRLLFVINDIEFFISHRLPIATAARDAHMDVHIAAPDGEGVDRLRREGWSIHAVPITRSGINPLKEMRAAWRMYKLFLALRPDIVHTVTIKAVLYGGLAARLARIPVVVSAIPGLGHVFVQSGLLASLRRRLVLIGYRLALRSRRGTVIFQNPDDRVTFVRAGIVAADHTALIRGAGVDMAEFRPSAESSGPTVVLLAARMLWSKGIGEFVTAAKRLKAQRVNARFVLVGGIDRGNPSAVSEEQLRSWSEGGTVEWWGMRRDMNAVFASCHIVCLPTYYGEGIPKVLIEAAACARPIVATDIPGCREVVKHEYNGLLIPPRQTDELVKALTKLIDNPALCRQMGQRGRQLVEAQFSVQQVIEKTLHVYAELLA